MREVIEVGELVREALPTNPRTRLTKRDDGLTIRHIEGTETRLWWCRFCWGSKPAKVHLRQAESIESVFLGWDQHKVTGEHIEHARTAAALAALNLSSSGE